MTSLPRRLPTLPRLDLRGTRTPPAAVRALLALLTRIDHGALTVVLPDGTTRNFGSATAAKPAVLLMQRWNVAADVLKAGDIGFAEGYLRGDWDTPDLPHLLTMLAANRDALGRAFFGSGLVAWLARLRHARNANTKAQARRNIVAHYDLGNAFYALWLDTTMTYSAACFDGDANRPLAAAQQAKYRRLLAALRLAPGAHILEIGAGWGGFAEVAAREGYRVTGLSLSDAQTAYARERIARAGLADRAEVFVRDYRDEHGRYDGVVSIEMFEAVGERWWPDYFAKLRAVLRPGGRACLQSITIAEDRFERYRRETDFIQQYIFPGGMLASPSRLVAEAQRAGLVVAERRMFGADYARTLTAWLAAFEANVEAIRAQGFDDTFVRCWRFYLAYCIAGFATGATDVGHFTFDRT